MLSTKEFYGINPKQFKDMGYSEVLAVKRKASQEAYNAAAEEYFNLPYNKEHLKEANDANREMLKHKKSLDVISMWEGEMK